jgi:type II secretory pathway predicted ATPase ExeA
MHSSDSVYNLPPFPAYPSIDRFIRLGSVQDAVDRIERSIQARDAISVVIGPPGTGKTLISEVLASRYKTTHRVIKLGETPFTDSDSFLRRVLHQSGADITNVPGGDLQLALFDHLCLGEESTPRMLLLIDEAQSLTTELLETIRTLTNLTREGEPRISVVMFGGNHFDELLIAPSMDGFRQRISTRCYLHPLNGEETAWYINQTILNCGCDPDATITADAISAVHHACSGLPRLINQLLSHAIEFAANIDEYLITDRIIDQSWAEVQQLPSPMVEEPEINVTESSVEFGELDSFDSPSFEPEPTCDENDVSALTSDASTPEHLEHSIESTESAAYDFASENEPDVAHTLNDEISSEKSAHLASDDEETLHTGPRFDGLSDAEHETSNAILLHNELNGDHFHEANASEQINERFEDQCDSEEQPHSQLHYPQLASPALASEPNSDVTAPKSFTERFEAYETTQNDDDLFGTFDEEEEIHLHTGTSIPAKPDDSNAPIIESVIHQEIIGISDILNVSNPDTIRYCDEAHQLPNTMNHKLQSVDSDVIPFHQDQATDNESSVDSATLDFISAHGSSSAEVGNTLVQPSNQEPPSAEASHPENSEMENSERENGEESFPIHLLHDDSDLLIIEDEVNMHRIDKQQTSPEPSQQSTSYQQMLKRMRSNGPRR